MLWKILTEQPHLESSSSLVCRCWHSVKIQEISDEFHNFVSQIYTLCGKRLPEKHAEFLKSYCNKLIERMRAMSTSSPNHGMSIHQAWHEAATLLQSLNLFIHRIDCHFSQDLGLKIWEPISYDSIVSSPSDSGTRATLTKTFIHELYRNKIPLRNWFHKLSQTELLAILARGDFLAILIKADSAPSKQPEPLFWLASLALISANRGMLSNCGTTLACGDSLNRVSNNPICIQNRFYLEDATAVLKILETPPFINKEPDQAREENLLRLQKFVKDSGSGIPPLLEQSFSLTEYERKFAYKAFVHTLCTMHMDSKAKWHITEDELKSAINSFIVEPSLSELIDEDELNRLRTLISTHPLNVQDVKSWSSTDQKTTDQRPCMFLFEREYEEVATIVSNCLFRTEIKETPAVIDRLEDPIAKALAQFQTACYCMATDDPEKAKKAIAKMSLGPLRFEMMQLYKSLSKARENLDISKTDNSTLSTPIDLVSNLFLRNPDFFIGQFEQTVLPMTMQDCVKTVELGLVDVFDTRLCKLLFQHITRLGGIEKALELFKQSIKPHQIPQEMEGEIQEVIVKTAIMTGHLDQAITAAEKRQWPANMLVPICHALYARGQTQQVKGILKTHLPHNKQLLDNQTFCDFLLLVGGADLIVENFLPTANYFDAFSRYRFVDTMKKVVTFLVKTNELPHAISIIETLKNKDILRQEELDRLSSCLLSPGSPPPPPKKKNIATVITALWKRVRETITPIINSLSRLRLPLGFRFRRN